MALFIKICVVVHVVSVITASPVFRLAAYYNDHMVLQIAPRQASLWGYAEHLAKIKVTLLGKDYNTVAANASFTTAAIWKVILDPVPPSGPFTISISSISNGVHEVINLIDILFGDVWICSGQSNMSFEVRKAFNGTEELMKSYQYPNIRVFQVGQVLTNVTFYDLHSIELPWSRPTPESLGRDSGSFFSAVCWYFGKELYEHFKYPIGLISSNWGGTPDEVWSSPDALRKCNMTGRKPPVYRDESLDECISPFGGPPTNHSILWNGMIHPLINMTIKGAIWYQGEANAKADPSTYNCTFPAMIDDWRTKWYAGTGGLTNKQFPFGFVQLGTSSLVEPGVIGNYPILRWHQTADFGYVPNSRLVNVFMAVAIDLADPTSPYWPVHSRYKADVGRRLALSARAVAYKEDYITYSGPYPTQVAATKHSLTIQFDHGKADIAVVNVDGFEICCSIMGSSCNESVSWANATITEQIDKSNINLSHNCTDGVITYVRYIWRDFPCTYKNCSIYSVENKLPGAPFILPLKYKSRGAPSIFPLKYKSRGAPFKLN